MSFQSDAQARLDVVNGAFDQIVKEESARLICNTAPEIGTVFTCKGELAALDIDVSPFEFQDERGRCVEDVQGR